MVAISLFGTIIAELNEVLIHMRTKTKGLEKILESYLVVQPRLMSILKKKFIVWYHLL
jgi:hypothetical protein